MAQAFDYSLRASELFKNQYVGLSENLYNSATVLLGRVKKTYNFTGKQQIEAVPLSFSGGVGSGSLPTANTADYDNVVILAKKVYARALIDRETIKASQSDEGAFVRGLKEVTEKAVESYMRNMSRILFGDGTGALGFGDGATNVTGAGTTGSPYAVVMSTGWNEANFEERDLVNYDAETSLLEIVSVVPSTRTVSFVGTSTGLAALTGSGPVPTNKAFYMQNSKDAEPQGLKGVCDATTGSLYSVPVARRWQATQVAAGGISINTDIMNRVMLEVERKVGKAPKLIITSYKQYEKLLNVLEDKKTYFLPARAENLKGIISFAGIEFVSTRGPIGVFADRFCDADRMYFLNDDQIEIRHRPDFGWFEDDGTVFMRVADSDAYEARYGGYLQVYIKPTFQGVITGLATA